MSDFRSDNTHGASAEIIEAIARVAGGTVASYGSDPITARLRERCRELFATDLDILPVFSGTAGNALAIAAMTPPWGGVFCHDEAHIHRDEEGAPEFFTHGAKLFPLPSRDGRLTPEQVARKIDEIALEGRTAKPACVSLTNATEAGTIYRASEVRAIADVAHSRGCRVHVDGARFANAVVSSGESVADLTWRAGVDILVFGATKNGAMAAELLVIFDRSLTEELTIRWHRGGHRLSKMRFLSAQLDAYLADDLWLRNARHANAMAARLADGLRAKGVELLRPVEANVVFARLPRVPEGATLYEWALYGEHVYRLVTGFSTTAEEVDAFLARL
ncbi:MAG TPA: beta-eliminating lyase-related protein [Thermoanaerobaculia bacterium]|nr:beta-eliminating lyase-related protein [Thermoanaerobaculia bacterium]